MQQVNLFKYIRRILTDERYKKEKELLAKECQKVKLWQLWELLFETDIRNGVVLEEKVYAYGSHIKESDYIHREIFVFLVAFLNLVIKPKKWYSIGDSTVKECVKEEVPLQENTTELNKDKI